MTKNTQEAINHPAHYGGDSLYEVIKVLENWFTAKQFEGFLLGNIIKYMLIRLPHTNAETY